MARLKRILIGVSTDPQLVASVRALVLYALPIAAELLIAWLSGISDPRWIGVIPVTVTVIRALEGAVDRALKGPQANDPKPAPVDHISA